MLPVCGLVGALYPLLLVSSECLIKIPMFPMLHWGFVGISDQCYWVAWPGPAVDARCLSQYTVVSGPCNPTAYVSHGSEIDSYASQPLDASLWPLVGSVSFAQLRRHCFMRKYNLLYNGGWVGVAN